jgi:hypothetical protein
VDRVEFEGHPLWAAVDELRDLLVRADEVAEPGHQRTLDQLRYEQLRYVIRRIRSRRPPPEATEAARTKLGRLDGHVRAAAAELSAFLLDGGGAHLTVAVGLVDWALLDLGVKGRSRPPIGSQGVAAQQQSVPRPSPATGARVPATGRRVPATGSVGPAAGGPAIGGPAAGGPAFAADSTPTVRFRRARHARRSYDRSVV